jgi:hypothetical protein
MIDLDVVAQTAAWLSESNNLNVALMKSTFRIRGLTSGGEPYIGTVFLLGVPVSNKEGTWRMVLVTADHVLSNTRGELAELILSSQVTLYIWTESFRSPC